MKCLSTQKLENFCDEHHRHEEDNTIDISTYLRVLGSVLYTSTRTSTEIATAVNILVTRIEKPTKCLMRSENRVILYLNNTRTYGLQHKRINSNSVWCASGSTQTLLAKKKRKSQGVGSLVPLMIMYSFSWVKIRHVPLFPHQNPNMSHWANVFRKTNELRMFCVKWHLINYFRRICSAIILMLVSKKIHQLFLFMQRKLTYIIILYDIVWPVKKSLCITSAQVRTEQTAWPRNLVETSRKYLLDCYRATTILSRRHSRRSVEYQSAHTNALRKRFTIAYTTICHIVCDT